MVTEYINLMKIVIKIYKNSIFVPKQNKMPLEEEYEDIRDDVEAVIDHLIRAFKKEKNFPDDSLNKVFSRYGHLFSLESEISVHKNRLAIRTFHLIRDTEIFDQYKKNLVSTIEIYGTVDEHGQIRYGYKGSAQKFIPDSFIETQIAKYKDGVEAFTQSLP
jgi:hypothetical protein